MEISKKINYLKAMEPKDEEETKEYCITVVKTFSELTKSYNSFSNDFYSLYDCLVNIKSEFCDIYYDVEYITELHNILERLTTKLLGFQTSDINDKNILKTLLEKIQVTNGTLKAMYDKILKDLESNPGTTCTDSVLSFFIKPIVSSQKESIHFLEYLTEDKVQKIPKNHPEANPVELIKDLNNYLKKDVFEDLKKNYKLDVITALSIL